MNQFGYTVFEIMPFWSAN